MDEDRMGASPFISGKQFSDKPATTEKASRLRLVRRNFLIVVGIAMVGGWLNPAYAESCKSLKKDLKTVNAKIQKQAGKIIKSGIPGDPAEAKRRPEMVKYEKYKARQTAIEQKMKDNNCN